MNNVLIFGVSMAELWLRGVFAVAVRRHLGVETEKSGKHGSEHDDEE